MSLYIYIYIYKNTYDKHSVPSRRNQPHHCGPVPIASSGTLGIGPCVPTPGEFPKPARPIRVLAHDRNPHNIDSPAKRAACVHIYILYIYIYIIIHIYI